MDYTGEYKEVKTFINNYKWWIILIIGIILSTFEYKYILSVKHDFDTQINILTNENMVYKDVKDVRYLPTIEANERQILQLRDDSLWIYIAHNFNLGFLCIVFLSGMATLAQLLYTRNKFTEKSINADGSTNTADERNKAMVLAAIFVGCAFALSPIIAALAALV